jgi:hypothetical protein
MPVLENLNFSTSYSARIVFEQLQNFLIDDIRQFEARQPSMSVRLLDVVSSTHGYKIHSE